MVKMENKKMNIVYKKVKDLIPYENNPRNNDEAVDYVAKSIKEFGFKVPCVVSSDGVLITGQTRLKAWKKLGIDEVPCIVADDLTEDQIKAFRLADNKVGEIATWDLDKLSIELDGLQDIDMSDFGFDIGDDAVRTEGGSTDSESGGENEDDSAGTREGDFGTDFSYMNQYAVTVICEDEADQQKVYEKLLSEGYNCRVVTV